MKSPLRCIGGWVGIVKLMCGRMSFDCFPAAAAIEFHPVIFAVFDFAGVLEGLSEEVAEEVIIGRVFEAEVAHVAEIFVEFFCKEISKERKSKASTDQESLHIDP